MGGITVALDWDGSPEAANLQPPGGFLVEGRAVPSAPEVKQVLGTLFSVMLSRLRRSRLELEACLRTCFTFFPSMGNFSTRLNAEYYYLVPIVGCPALVSSHPRLASPGQKDANSKLSCCTILSSISF